VVAGFILRAAYDIFKMASAILLDSKAADEKEIREALSVIPEIKGMHHIRSRGTEQNLFIDMHVLADKEMLLMDAHALAHRIEKTLQAHYQPSKVQVITHMEPFVENYKKK
ncbi:MAG: hypothetical protein JXK92_03290, partial [Erysipelotrichaceae bacterium]|nr:hypothetical protein [Erysipelotrichaceae bacterium]